MKINKFNFEENFHYGPIKKHMRAIHLIEAILFVSLVLLEEIIII
jgi:hypothetical protein